MGIEIERKFIIDVSKMEALQNGLEVVQGYIHASNNTVIRARIIGNEAFITLKGENKGLQRLEFEYSIPPEDAVKIIDNFCQGKVIEKIRYTLPHGSHLWEIDIFKGDNRGLTLAEVELNHTEEEVLIPDWVLEEVTGDPRYYNSNLVSTPYNTWKTK